MCAWDETEIALVHNIWYIRNVPDERYHIV